MRKIERRILLNPGPVTTTDSVKYAQVVPDICPREKEFGCLMDDISRELTKIVASPQHYVTVLFAGSGTAAVESALTSVVPHNKTVIIVNNGAYGKRMCEIAQVYNMNYIEFKSSPVFPIDFNRLKRVIKKGKSISHLAVVHNETTTGLLNDLDKLGEIAEEFSLELIVDAMSSYGAIPINMKRQNISYLCASANKNIQGMPGVSFVVANKRALARVKRISPRNFYLNLFMQHQYFLKHRQMRFTPPVQTIYALRQAIMELNEEGVENRYVRYSRSWEVLRRGLKKMGLKYLVEDRCHSKIVTSICLPKGIDFCKMHDYFYERGITIYPGKVKGLNTFRVANIGNIDQRDIKKFLILLENYLMMNASKRQCKSVVKNKNARIA